MRHLLSIVLVLLLPVLPTPGKTSTPLESIDRAVKADEYRQVTSVLVSRRGVLELEGYWNGANSSSMHDTRSATKTLVALAVGKAIEQGFIDSVQSPALSYFKAHQPFRFANPQKSAISIRDLLTMSSALDCDDNNWDSPGNEEHMYPARRWLYFVLDLPTKASYERDEFGYGPFSYCTAGSFLLGQVVEAATGSKFDAYFRKVIQSPLGIDRVDWDRSSSGEIQTGGGAEMTSRDLLKLGELVLNLGSHHGKEIVDPSWVEEMITAHVAANSEQGYGYQIWKRDFACGDNTVEGWYFAGNGGNKVVAIRELGLAVVITATLYGTRGMHEQTTKLLEDEVLAAQLECRV